MSGTYPRRVFESPRFDVDLVQVRTHAGTLVERAVVMHPGAVAVLPILDGGRIVLIRNHRYSIDQELWELPAGGLEKGEPPIECAGRELIEETGYRAEKLTPLCVFYTCPGICTEKMHVFLATGLRSARQALEEAEHIRVFPTEPEEVWAMLADNRIQDAKTIAALLHYRAFGVR